MWTVAVLALAVNWRLTGNGQKVKAGNLRMSGGWTRMISSAAADRGDGTPEAEIRATSDKVERNAIGWLGGIRCMAAS
jgi:hypothetical protein